MKNRPTLACLLLLAVSLSVSVAAFAFQQGNIATADASVNQVVGDFKCPT